MVIFVYFAVIALAFFLLIVLPQRRRANAHRAVLAALQVGDEIITIGGILGTIRELDDEKVELEVAEGVVITVARNAIAQLASPVGTPAVPAPHDDSSDADQVDE
jgi:preprotein translocase subunit YajC